MSKQTPEGVVKAIIKDTLHEWGIAPAGKEREYTGRQTGWYYTPMNNGMGVGGIPDFVGCYKGHFFAIEAKAPSGKPTERQLQRKYGIMNGGGKYFLIDGAAGYLELQSWFGSLK